MAGLTVDVAAVWQALRQVHDPEIPVNVVDLGLIADVAVEEGRVRVGVTLTSTACACVEWILEDIEQAVSAVPGVSEVQVQLNWRRPWSRARISPRGQAALRERGIGV